MRYAMLHVIAVALASVAYAQDEDLSPGEVVAQQHVEDMQRIVKALEKVHPEVVAEVEHEERAQECRIALRDVGKVRVSMIAECFYVEADHGTDIASNDAMLKALRSRHPNEMAKQNDLFWRMTLDAARMAYYRRRDAEVEIEDEVAEDAGSDSGDGE